MQIAMRVLMFKQLYIIALLESYVSNIKRNIQVISTCTLRLIRLNILSRFFAIRTKIFIIYSLNIIKS